MVAMAAMLFPVERCWLLPFRVIGNDINYGIISCKMSQSRRRCFIDDIRSNSRKSDRS
jgi:hypothetical protein